MGPNPSRGNLDLQINDLKQTIATTIRRSTGVMIVMPKLTTLQVQTSDELRDRFVNSLFMGDLQYTQPSWFIEYDATVRPQCADVAWTEDLVGAVTSAVLASSTFDLTDLSLTGYGNYSYTHDLSNSQGVTFEAQLRVLSADIATGSGFLMRVEDGVQRFDMYVRSADLDVGGSAVTRDLTSFRTVRMTCQSSELVVYVDGQRVLVGGPSQTTSAELVRWGTEATADIAHVQVLKVRAGHGVIAP